MRYVMDLLREEEAKKKLPVIRLEIDYELLTLHDAMVIQDKIQIIKSKERLKQLRKELIEISND